MDTKRILGEAKKLKAKKVLLQIPEGLKMKAREIADSLKKEGLEVLISCEPCFGACDIPSHNTKKLGCDAIIHIGHTDWGLKTEVPVIYEEYRLDADPVPVLEKNIGLLKPAKTIGLFTTVQYLDAFQDVKKFLEKQGKKVKTGKSRHCKHPGQVIGCDFSGPQKIEDSVDAFLFFGTGMFHSLGLARKVKKPVLFLSLENKNLISMKNEQEMMERIRFAQIEKAKEGQNFGVLVSTKPGQMKVKLAEKVRKKLEKKGKDAWILVMDNITPEKLLGLKLDAMVNCACPRLTEDFRQFKKPILDPEEADKI